MRVQRMAYIVVGIGAAIGFFMLVSFERWTVPPGDLALAASLEPTLHADDLVLLWTRSTIDRGDVVRCTDPNDPRELVAGRVLGVAGDHVEVSGNGVTTSGLSVESAGACNPRTRNVRDPLGSREQVDVDCNVEEMGPHRYPTLKGERTIFTVTATVEPGKLWLVSDNRRFHLDSRDFGQIDRATCKRIFYLLVPATHGSQTDRGMSFVP
jgi:signal peptidase I